MSMSDQRMRPRGVVGRRGFLRAALLGTSAALLAACGSPAPAAPTKPADVAKPAESKPTAAAAKPAEAAKPAAATAPSAAKPAASPGGDRLTVALSADIEVFDPQKLSASTQYFVNANLFESLYVRDMQGKLSPGLAEQHVVKDGGQTYEFTLRKGVKFHNGDPFSAADVKYSFDRAVNPDTKYTFAGQLANVERVDVLDDQHVAFRLKTADASFLPVLSWYFLVAPSRYHQQVGDDGFAERPVGTGPFKLTSRRIKESIELEAFADHWRKAPAIRSVLFRPAPDASSRVAMLQAGEADIAVNLPPILERQIAGTAGLRTISAPTDVMVAVTIDTITKPDSPFADRRVRQALNYAVDKQRIIERLLSGQATPIYGPVISSMIGYDESIKPYPYDPARAKQLLAEAGHANGFEASIAVPAGRYTQGEQVVEAVAGYLGEVGIPTQVTKLESQAWLAKLRAKDIYPMSLLGRGDNTFDPHGRLMNGVHSKAPFSFYHNPEVDAAILKGITILDPKEREAHYKQLYRALHEEAIELYLYQEHSLFGLRERVNWQPAPGEQFTKLWEATLK